MTSHCVVLICLLCVVGAVYLQTKFCHDNYYKFSIAMYLKIFQTSQSIHKYGNEVFFVCLFVSVVTVNKLYNEIPTGLGFVLCIPLEKIAPQNGVYDLEPYVLSELRFTVPTVFQGWQTLSCVILLSSFIKLKKIQNDLQILDAKALALLLPALVSFALGIVAGSKALADLPVPVFLAVTNLYPAVQILILKKNATSGVSLKVCGSTVIFGTVMIILIYSTTSTTASPIVWLLGHVFLNLFYYSYLHKLNLDLSNTTQIYYRNFFSVIILFPISLYLNVLRWPSGDWRFYTGCFLSGVLGTLLQIWTFKILTKPNYLQFEGLGKVISSIIAYLIFFADIEPFIWVLIVINFLVCATFLRTEEEKPVNLKSDIILSMSPPHLKRFGADGISLV